MIDINGLLFMLGFRGSAEGEPAGDHTCDIDDLLTLTRGIWLLPVKWFSRRCCCSPLSGTAGRNQIFAIDWEVDFDEGEVHSPRAAARVKRGRGSRC